MTALALYGALPVVLGVALALVHHRALVADVRRQERRRVMVALERRVEEALEAFCAPMAALAMATREAADGMVRLSGAFQGLSIRVPAQRNRSAER